MYLFPQYLWDLAVDSNWLSFLVFHGDLGSDTWRYLTLTLADGNVDFKNWAALFLMSCVGDEHLETCENPSASLHWKDLGIFSNLALWMGFITSNTSHSEDIYLTLLKYLTGISKSGSALSDGKVASPRREPSSRCSHSLCGGFWLFLLTLEAAEIHGLDET